MSPLARSVLIMGWLSSLLAGCRCPDQTSRRGPAPEKQAPLKRLAIYYGWPSRVDGARSVSEAAEKLSGYDVVVLGAGLQRPEHEDHASTRKIVAQLAGREVFGYIPLGGNTGLTTPQIEEQARAWKAVGVAGVFLDEAGYDFGNTRQRQNQAIGAAHALGLRAFANAFDPDDLFVARRGEHNASGEPTALRRGDGYLYESFGLRLGKPEEEAARRAKLEKLAAARELGVRLFGVTTAAAPGAFDGGAWARVVEEARRARLDGLGWGEHQFAAQDNKLPWRW
jgi:hypothetical protein